MSKNIYLNSTEELIRYINEDLPIYMESLPGTMMKKIFTNLKLFIENLS